MKRRWSKIFQQWREELLTDAPILRLRWIHKAKYALYCIFRYIWSRNCKVIQHFIKIISRSVALSNIHINFFTTLCFIVNICNIRNVPYVLFFLKHRYYKSDLCPSTSSFVDLHVLLMTENSQWLSWFKLVPLSGRFGDTIFCRKIQEMTRQLFHSSVNITAGKAILITCSDVLCIAGHRFNLTTPSLWTNNFWLN